MTSTDAASLNKRLKWMNYLGMVLALAGAALFVVVAGAGWSWPPFFWGVAVGLLQIALSRLSMAGSYRVLKIPSGEVERSKQRVRERYRPLYPTALGTGVAVGIVSAGLGSAAPDVIFTLYVLLTGLVFPTAMLVVLRRRLAAVGKD